MAPKEGTSPLGSQLLADLSCCTVSTRFSTFLITKRVSKRLCRGWGLGNRLVSKHLSKSQSHYPNPPGRFLLSQHISKASRNHNPTICSVVQLHVSTLNIQPSHLTDCCSPRMCGPGPFFCLAGAQENFAEWKGIVQLLFNIVTLIKYSNLSYKPPSILRILFL